MAFVTKPSLPSKQDICRWHQRSLNELIFTIYQWMKMTISQSHSMVYLVYCAAVGQPIIGVKVVVKMAGSFKLLLLLYYKDFPFPIFNWMNEIFMLKCLYLLKRVFFATKYITSFPPKIEWKINLPLIRNVFLTTYIGRDNWCNHSR